MHAIYLACHGGEAEAEVGHGGCFAGVLLFGGFVFSLHDEDEVRAVGVEFAKEPFDVPLERAEDCEGEGGGLEDIFDLDVRGSTRVAECEGLLDGAVGESQTGGRSGS